MPKDGSTIIDSSHAHRVQTKLWRVAVLTLLIGWLYYPILLRLVHQWYQDPNFSHGFFVPLFSLYVLWRKRVGLRSLAPLPSSWGLLIATLSLCMLVTGVLGAELFFSRVSLLFLIAGLIVFFFGWRFLRAVLFPWAVLFLMIPLPALVFNQVTMPLQILASSLASTVLPLLGVPVLREGNIIRLPAMSLEVAEACSGIRSLLSLVTLAVIFGYMIKGTQWVRTALVLSAVPIAIAENSLRIIGTGILVQYWNPEKAVGFFHAFSGGLMFVTAVAMLFLIHGVLVRTRHYGRPLFGI